jgi:hypothetical protein
MASPPNLGKAATASKSRSQKPFPPKKAKTTTPKQPPMPPQQSFPQQAPNASGIAQQILGPRSAPRSEY